MYQQYGPPPMGPSHHPQGYHYDMPPPNRLPPPPGYYGPPPVAPSHFYPPSHYPYPPMEPPYFHDPHDLSSEVSLTSYPSPDDTPDNRSIATSAVSSKLSIRTKSKISKQKESDESGYISTKNNSSRTSRRSWSTAKLPLPENSKEAAKLERRRARNRIATKKSRDRLTIKAAKADRLDKVLSEVTGHFQNIQRELQKLHITNVMEQIRLAGVDTSHLVHEIQDLIDKINVAKINENGLKHIQDQNCNTLDSIL